MKDKYFTEEQMKVIYAAIDANKTDPKYIALEIICLTGARTDELARIKFEDVDIYQGRITIRRGSKGSEGRTSAISRELRNRIMTIRHEKNLAPTDRIVQAYSNGNAVTVKRELRKVLERIKAQNWPGQKLPGLHGFRHRKAVLAYAETKDVFMMQEILGHKSLASTAHYRPRVDEAKLTEIQLKR